MAERDKWDIAAERYFHENQRMLPHAFAIDGMANFKSEFLRDSLAAAFRSIARDERPAGRSDEDRDVGVRLRVVVSFADSLAKACEPFVRDDTEAEMDCEMCGDCTACSLDTAHASYLGSREGFDRAIERMPAAEAATGALANRHVWHIHEDGFARSLCGLSLEGPLNQCDECIRANDAAVAALREARSSAESAAWTFLTAWEDATEDCDRFTAGSTLADALHAFERAGGDR